MIGSFDYAGNSPMTTIVVLEKFSDRGLGSNAQYSGGFYTIKLHSFLHFKYFEFRHQIGIFFSTLLYS